MWCVYSMDKFCATNQTGFQTAFTLKKSVYSFKFSEANSIMYIYYHHSKSRGRSRLDYPDSSQMWFCQLDLFTVKSVPSLFIV